MLKNIKSNNAGFTLVELLIVIVIIAILAVLTLVGVNGYINRANDSKAKDSAGQLRTKIEAWNSVKGAYPSTADVTGGLVSTTGEPVEEAKLTDSIKDMLAASNAVTTDKPLFYAPCSETNLAGGDITYYQKSATGGKETIHLGDACS